MWIRIFGAIEKLRHWLWFLEETVWQLTAGAVPSSSAVYSYPEIKPRSLISWTPALLSSSPASSLYENLMFFSKGCVTDRIDVYIQNTASAHHNTICFLRLCTFLDVFIYFFFVFPQTLSIKVLPKVPSSAEFMPPPLFLSLSLCSALWKEGLSDLLCLIACKLLWPHTLCFSLFSLPPTLSPTVCARASLHTRVCVCTSSDLCVWVVLRLAYVPSGRSLQAAFNQKMSPSIQQPI